MLFDDLQAVYMAQVFTSNVLLQFDLSSTQQQRACTPQTTNFWNRVPECNVLEPQPSFRLCKLAEQKACESGDYANANASTSECISQQPPKNPD